MSEEYESLIIERDEHMLTITINRPKVRNALHSGANLELSKIFDEFENDDQLWVAIITGAGDKAFCAGNDLKAMASGVKMGNGGWGGITNRPSLNKPIIAAINGFALGGGLELALSCDIIVAEEHATMGLPEPRRGLMALAGGMEKLPRQIPYHLAMGMLMTGRHITAQQALQFGLVNEVVPTGKGVEAAKVWADDVLKCSPICVQGTKEIVKESLNMELDAAVAKTFPAAGRVLGSADFREGMQAFMQKREPKWIGK